MKIKIGLETHVQLNTKSKLFCSCANPVFIKEPAPNSLICPTCLGMPGSKPVLNEKAIEQAVKIAIALKCKIAKLMWFSRKTYFYPDMSKNFQITQYEAPLATNGLLDIGGKKIRIKRIHIEEDPAKLLHIGGLGGKYVLVDYNRSGIPLVEIVTEPDLSSPEEARNFISKLTTILEYLGIYNPNTYAVIKTDTNVSIENGPRIEIKNITGAKEISDALKYEIVRQKTLLEKGELKRETRSWNPDLGVTESLRAKEEEEEYGYIFEPDLTVIEISKDYLNKIVLPELPDQKCARFKRQYKISSKLIEALISELDIAELFEYVAKKIESKLAASWIAGYLKKTLNWYGLRWSQTNLKAEWILYLLREIEKGSITDRNAEMTIRKMIEERTHPAEIIKKYNFSKIQFNLDKIVRDVIAVNKKCIDDYKTGKVKALEYLVGQVIKKTEGRADPKDIRKAILKALA
jgi:aspartyl-tRNA(Asn)/glutamyl-tRNA(Gln) amidotransferase subunit B